jgi:beta-lactamase class A
VGFVLALLVSSVSTGMIVAAEEATPPASPAGPIPEELPLPVAIDQVIPDDGGVYGIVVLDPGRNLVYSRNSGVPFISASLYKLPLMAHIYLLIERGHLHLTDTIPLQEVFWAEGADGYYDWSWMGMTTTVEEALFAAGAYSSNVAAWALATLTTWSQVEATARSIGMVDTYLYVSPYALPFWPPAPGSKDSADAFVTAVSFIDSMAAWGPVMLTTPRDIATFFSGLLAGRVVSVGASWAMIDILSRQVVTDRFPQLLPEQAWLAHKTGNLDQGIHDAGIIYAGAGPVIVVGMTEATVDEWTAITTLQRLALTVYRAYES